jgi:uncharacterized membrane protein YdcZ (DUF606 family)
LKPIVIVPATVGALVVMQAGINRLVGTRHGLPVAVLINASMFLTAASCLWAVARWRGDLLPPGLALPSDATPLRLKAWYLLPGLCGFLATLGGPLAMAQLGALRTFVVMIAAQVVASAVWDWAVLHQPPGWQRVAGGALAVAGVFVASWRG